MVTDLGETHDAGEPVQVLPTWKSGVKKREKKTLIVWPVKSCFCTSLLSCFVTTQGKMHFAFFGQWSITLLKTVQEKLTWNLLPNAWHIFLQDVPGVYVGYAFVFCLLARMMLSLEQGMCHLRLFVPPENNFVVVIIISWKYLPCKGTKETCQLPKPHIQQSICPLLLRIALLLHLINCQARTVHFLWSFVCHFWQHWNEPANLFFPPTSMSKQSHAWVWLNLCCKGGSSDPQNRLKYYLFPKKHAKW